MTDVASYNGGYSSESDNFIVAWGILQIFAPPEVGFSFVGLLLVAAAYILMRFSRVLSVSTVFFWGVLVMTLVITLLGLDGWQFLEFDGTPLDASKKLSVV